MRLGGHKLLFAVCMLSTSPQIKQALFGAFAGLVNASVH